jgi:hypothetical protein
MLDPHILALRQAGSGEDRLRPGGKQSRNHHDAARPHPDPQGTGPQHARHHLRDGDADDARGFVVHRLLALLPVTRAGPIIVAVIAALVSSPLSAREYRSREVAREFQRDHPCPSTGQTSGPCPGIGGITSCRSPVAGPDAVSNLQWQTIADARAKDTWERKACAIGARQ